jgi:hypothetical protein
VLAQLARAAARHKISQLEEALEGAEFFTARHAALLAKVLQCTGRLSADTDDLSQVIKQLLARTRNSCSRPDRCPAGYVAPPRTPSPKPAST